MPVKKIAVKKTVRGPAASVSRRASSLSGSTGSLRLRAGTPSSASPLTSRPRSLSVPVYSLAGRAVGTLALPKEIFGQKVNKKLLAQAVRVYTTNQKVLLGSTKTRGEVEGSTAKIYRQKGTGRARHGAIRAPIFVGGGIVFGPKPRKVQLELPQKMKKAALIGALSSKLLDKNIIGLDIEKISGKTKEMANLVKELKLRTALIVTDKKVESIVRAARNIPGLTVIPASQLNAYEILRHRSVILSKAAIEALGKKEAVSAL